MHHVDGEVSDNDLTVYEQLNDDYTGKSCLEDNIEPSGRAKEWISPEDDEPKGRTTHVDAFGNESLHIESPHDRYRVQAQRRCLMDMFMIYNENDTDRSKYDYGFTKNDDDHYNDDVVGVGKELLRQTTRVLSLTEDANYAKVMKLCDEMHAMLRPKPGEQKQSIEKTDGSIEVAQGSRPVIRKFGCTHSQIWRRSWKGNNKGLRTGRTEIRDSLETTMLDAHVWANSHYNSGYAITHSLRSVVAELVVLIASAAVPRSGGLSTPRHDTPHDLADTSRHRGRIKHKSDIIRLAWNIYHMIQQTMISNQGSDYVLTVAASFSTLDRAYTHNTVGN